MDVSLTMVSSLVFIGCGYPFLSNKNFPPPLRRYGKAWTATTELKILRSLKSKILLAAFYVSFNLAILILPLIPPYRNANGSPRKVLGWYYIVANSIVMTIGTIYYFSVHNSRWSILRLAGVEPHINTLDHHDETYGYRNEMVVTSVSTSFCRIFPFMTALVDCR